MSADSSDKKGAAPKAGGSRKDKKAAKAEKAAADAAASGAAAAPAPTAAAAPQVAGAGDAKPKADKKDKSKDKKSKATPAAGAPAAGTAADGTAAAETDAKSTPAASTWKAAPKGHLRDWTVPMAAAYKPSEVEPGYDDYWNACELFKADAKDNKSPPFVMVIPPPNVTGTLHLGHALTCAVEDAIIRWRRMSGENVLWLPGTDHAGIATQVVVEKKLMREQKKNRHDLGREKFLQEVWKWKQANGSRIYDQIRCLGASVDWSREAFTMDEKLSVAVKEAFVRLHDSGLIYRASRLVSWSCQLRTAISNIEVNKIELKEPKFRKVPGHAKEVEFGVIHKFAYRVKDSPTNEQIIVATTRLETMLGDVAVAVHSTDVRYKHLIGKSLVHPFLPDRAMKVIADDVLVDPKFGTGAVKVTPAHDPNDYKCGTDHKLEFINILNDDGTLNKACGKFAGMKRFEVRELLVNELTALGLFHGKEKNPMTLSICSRSNDVIEPVIRPQWWVKCKGMADRAMKEVNEGRLEIIPNTFKATWDQWLGSIQDWCISRQLWWGHRIPAYHIKIDGKETNDWDDKYWVVARTEEEARKIAVKRFASEVKDEKSIHLKQDDDVLDTWFSSGLFPFSTMGWPNETPDMAKFFPGHLLETGHDILFFWVARMVMMGLQLTDKLPFTKVFLHAMVRDKFGRKMSKSLGNVIDPLDVRDGVSLKTLTDKLLSSNLDEKEIAKAVEGQKRDFPNGIEECGADALRFGLLSYSTLTTQNINLDIARVVTYRQFGNKLWNATKFALLNFATGYVPPANAAAVTALVAQTKGLPDQWILHRLSVAVERANAMFAAYDFAALCDAVHTFWYTDFCDQYLELIKPVMNSDQKVAENVAKKNASLAVLYTCLNTALRLTHPTMPFLTEELWHRLPGAITRTEPTTDRAKTGSIAIAPYPKPAETGAWADAHAEYAMTVLQSIAGAARSSRASLGLTKKRVDMYVVASDAKEFDVVNRYGADAATLSVATKVVALRAGATAASGTAAAASSEIPAGCITTVISPTLIVHLPVAGLVDLKVELAKYEKKYRALKQEIDGIISLTSGSAYEEKTKPEVKKQLAEKLASKREEILKLTASIVEFKKILPADTARAYYNERLASLTKELDAANATLAKQNAQIVTGKETPKKVLKAISDAEKEISGLNTEIAAVKAEIAQLK